MDNASGVFPPLQPGGTSRSAVNDSLYRTLRRVRAHGGDSKPTAQAIAAALRQIHSQKGPLSEKQINLLAAMIGALESKSHDGWSLTLKGPRGRPRTAAQEAEMIEIGLTMYEEVEAGHGYLSALAKAEELHGAKKSKAAQAYREMRPHVSGIEAWARDLLAPNKPGSGK
jgi:hypothetical protein